GTEASPQRVPSASACEPFREAIALGLSRGRNAMAIWQDLVAEQGFPGRQLGAGSALQRRSCAAYKLPP
ncbi:MAG TPA: hypothetical protein VFI95_22310, partial [Terriglobales bacterium]|nr:hypothetical protein [Terriglobales bacterium]